MCIDKERREKAICLLNTFASEKNYKKMLKMMVGNRSGYTPTYNSKSVIIYIADDERYYLLLIDDKYGYFDRDGNQLIDLWFDSADYSFGAIGVVRIGYKYNFITRDFKLVWDKPIEKWFDFAHNSIWFCDEETNYTHLMIVGFASKKYKSVNNGYGHKCYKWNFIIPSDISKFVSKKWYDNYIETYDNYDGPEKKSVILARHCHTWDELYIDRNGQMKIVEWIC